MFEKLEQLPPDPILGLTDAFKEDPNPDKINLGVGVYKDSKGKTPILKTVKKAEKLIVENENTKSYLPINGGAEYGGVVQRLLFGEKLGAMKGLVSTAQTPGGTGALRVAGEFLKAAGGDVMWVSDPTWANHKNIFSAAGLTIKTYPYYDAAKKGLAIDAMLEGINGIAEGDIILLHACCHNPTGVDPDAGQWDRILDAVKAAKVVPLFDFAYQGFGVGIEEDAAGLRKFVGAVPELLVASSFSKNFGLYNERVGALTVVAGAEDPAKAALSHVKGVIRKMYSNPPSHGGSVVATIMNDEKLRAEWLEELAGMRGRINTMRSLFVETLKSKGVEQDFSFIQNQNGMFSFSGLNPEQVKQLRAKYSIYIVGSGRINVAGITESNIGKLCDAIAEVV